MAAISHASPGSPGIIERLQVAAADGAQVSATPIPLLRATAIYAELKVTITGGPTADARASLEASADGTNWHEVVRFKDATVSLVQVARVGSGVTGTVGDLAGAALNSAAATGAIKDGPIGGLLRLVTKVQTLTGGTTPKVDFQAFVAVS